MSTTRNPYIAGSPVTGEEMFFGREDVLEFVQRTLTGQFRDNPIILYGQRRTGKTSVLYQVGRRIGPRYICVLVDLQGFALRGLEGFLWELASHMARVLQRQYGVAMASPDRDAFRADPHAYFRGQFLDMVWAAVGSRNVLLMLDEVLRLNEQVQSGLLEKDVFDYLRHLMQHHERLSFLLSLGSGSRDVDIAEVWASLGAVGLAKRISFLTPEAAEALITEPVKGVYEVSREARERLLSITSCHPYYTQLICQCLFARCQQKGIRTATASDVNAVLNEAVELGSPNLKFVWEEATAAEKATMAGLAEASRRSHRPVRIAGIRDAWSDQGVNLPEGMLIRAAEALTAYDVITGHDQHRFTIELQRLWLLKYRTLSSVRQELRRSINEWRQADVGQQQSISGKDMLDSTLTLEALDSTDADDGVSNEEELSSESAGGYAGLVISRRAAESLHRAILRIRKADGRIVGAGFLISGRYAITSAHVVEAALGAPIEREFGLGAKLRLDFPLVAPGSSRAATVVMWDPGNDIAGLWLTGDPPRGTGPAHLIRVRDTGELWDHPFRTLGFPGRYDAGVWSSGRFRGRQAPGYFEMEGATATGSAIGRGFSGAPVWDDELDGVVGMLVKAEGQPNLPTAYLVPSDLLLQASPDLAIEALPPSPYRGLFAFREEDAELFFGREELIERLVDLVIHHSLITVVGPSGSGKSSLIFAGAIPQLRKDGRWLIASFRPATGASPLHALASALLPLVEPFTKQLRSLTEVSKAAATSRLAEMFASGQLADIVDLALKHTAARRLLLVIDQFEEIYTKAESAVTRQFIDVILGALSARKQRPTPPLTLVLALRSDFLDQALEHPDLARALQGTNILVGRMTHEQLRQVIEGPSLGVTYETGLVERIIEDVGEGAGKLPLLEFTLTLLWENQRNRTLTHLAYQLLGGVRGALASYAEQTYSSLSAPQQAAAQRLFLQLVQPVEEGRPVRRRVSRRDLSEADWWLAQQLVSTRLLTTGVDPDENPTVELVHEALISGWSRLRDWIEADQAFRAWQEDMRRAARMWQANSRSRGALLRGEVLQRAIQWLNLRPEEISSLEREFIQASQRSERREMVIFGSVLIALVVSVVILSVVLIMR